MKLLMIYATRFTYRTSVKALDGMPDISEENSIDDALIGFIHAEQADEEASSMVETKMIKNLKWAARKNNTRTIVLHSFAHLSESKASPEWTKTLFDNAERRLVESDYAVSQTPFGYFLDLDIQAPGTPMTRLFKDI